MDILTLDKEKPIPVITGKTRVVLVGKGYSPEPAEPVHGSLYACVGTIMHFTGTGSGYDVRVEWDNDRSNAYYLRDLRMIEELPETNPNKSYKRWGG
jgi:hypothetical protein